MAITGIVQIDPSGVGTTNTSGTAPAPFETVFLDLMGDDKLDPGDPTVNTDASGSYSFTGLAPGTYTVEVAPFPGTVATFPAGGGQTLTVAAVQVGAAGPLGIIPTTSLLPLSYSATPFGSANPDVQTAEVNGVYQIILGRAPDPAGGANAIAYIKAGGSLAQVSGDLLVSTEYDTDTVRSFYQAYLDRAPSSAEQSAGVSFLQGGGTQNQLAANLLDSAEFNTLNPTDSGFVRQLYIDVLGRLPSATETAGVVGMLNTGTTRSTVVASLINSIEADTRAMIGQSGLLFASTSDDPAPGVSTVAGLQAGYTQINILVAFFASPGYIARANTSLA